MNSDSRLVYLDELFLEFNEIVPKCLNDLYRPRNLTNVPCLAVNTNGFNGWPPKLCIYNHYSLVKTCEIFSNGNILEFRSIDTLLNYGSFEHLENLFMFLAAIVTGSTIVQVSKFDYVKLIDAIKKHQINLTILPVNIIIKLIKDDQHSLPDTLVKIIVFGGKLSTSLCHKLLLRYANIKSIRTCYFIAETPCPIAMIVRNCQEYTSVGFPLPGTQIKIIKLTDCDEMLPAYSTGLVVIGRMKEMFSLGYLSIERSVFILFFNLITL